MTRGGRQRMNYEIKNGYSQEIFGDIALQAALFYYESLGFTVKVTGIHKKDLVTHKKKVTTAMNEHSADIMRRYKKVIDGEAKKKIIVPHSNNAGKRPIDYSHTQLLNRQAHNQHFIEIKTKRLHREGKPF